MTAVAHTPATVPAAALTVTPLAQVLRGIPSLRAQLGSATDPREILNLLRGAVSVLSAGNSNVSGTDLDALKTLARTAATANAQKPALNTDWNEQGIPTADQVALASANLPDVVTTPGRMVRATLTATQGALLATGAPRSAATAATAARLTAEQLERTQGLTLLNDLISDARALHGLLKPAPATVPETAQAAAALLATPAPVQATPVQATRPTAPAFMDTAPTPASTPTPAPAQARAVSHEGAAGIFTSLPGTTFGGTITAEDLCALYAIDTNNLSEANFN